MIPQRVRDWLKDNGSGEISSSRPVLGGCINNGLRIFTQTGETFFLKTNPDSPADMFLREAEGLKGLTVTGGPRVPTPHLAGRDFLLLEDLQPAPQEPDYWPEFGRRLAVLHGHSGSRFGFSEDNYIGSTPQPNPWTSDGHAFFGRHRLMYQASLARTRGLLSPAGEEKVKTLSARLKELIPDQPPSIIHGDLWSGNAITDRHGQPAIIDPATHYGWAEAELAMTALFGPFPVAFYSAYESIRPLAPGYRERFPIYNLYHLLNHLNLFGESYLRQVYAVLDRLL